MAECIIMKLQKNDLSNDIYLKERIGSECEKKTNKQQPKRKKTTTKKHTQKQQQQQQQTKKHTNKTDNYILLK